MAGAVTVPVAAARPAAASNAHEVVLAVVARGYHARGPERLRIMLTDRHKSLHLVVLEDDRPTSRSLDLWPEEIGLVLKALETARAIVLEDRPAKDELVLLEAERDPVHGPGEQLRLYLLRGHRSVALTIWLGFPPSRNRWFVVASAELPPVVEAFDRAARILIAEGWALQ